MKKTSAEDLLFLADCRIEDAQERIRRQKQQLLEIVARGEDASLKIQFISLLTDSLDSMQCYRAGILRTQKVDAANKLLTPLPEGTQNSQQL